MRHKWCNYLGRDKKLSLGTTRVPITIYANFECYQPKCFRKAMDKPSGYRLFVKSDYENTVQSFYKNETFDGDIRKSFVKRVIEIRNEIENISAKKMIFTEEDEANYNSSNTILDL